MDKSVEEIASGMNDKRPKLTKLLSQSPGRLVVEHKDRLTRFGFNYFDVLLPKLGWELVVIHKDKVDQDDLMKDLVSVITSFCCRLYGLRRGKSKADGIKTQICKERSLSVSHVTGMETPIQSEHSISSPVLCLLLGV